MQPPLAPFLRRFRSIALCGIISFAAVPLCFPQELSLDQRVVCRQALEAVHWENRIWPSSSGRAKPSLDEVMSRPAIAAAVQDDLRKSAALQRFWNRTITGEQLQEEIDRMARQSREPAVLRRLFAALGDDPRMVAECLARPLLTERLLRNWYAGDGRFHGELRSRIENELIHSGRAAGAMSRLTGAYSEVEWIRGGPNGGPVTGGDESRNVRRLDDAEWDRMLWQLVVALQDDARVEAERRAGAMSGAATSPVQTESLPLGRVSRLIERDDRFLVTAVLSRGGDRLTVASVTWRKRSFDTWWDDVARQVDAQVEAVDFPYVLPEADFFPCQGDTWILTNTLAPLNRAEHTAVWTGAEMIVWGGYSGFYENTGGLYSPATDHWVPTSTTSAPAGRFRHTAVWTGTEMIVWGGRIHIGGSSSFSNTGGRYAPLTDSWSATATTAAPSARDVHTAVWTGSRMVVWGGSDGGELDTGGIYDPGGNSWTATSGTDAPAARQRHTAVWIGTEMIVWGGVNAGTALDSGARFDPGTNTWTAISDTGAPIARQYHTAVWDDTDNEMIVWGGRDGSYLNSGGRYDPAMNSWSATTTTDAPDGRRYHTAVWDDTNKEMIVWGGFSGAFEKSGGRYDPSADSWTATPTATAPIARYLHSAVWTGTEMIVWGGSDGGKMSTGGRYDPVGNSWVPTANSQSPLARHNHTALWTGAEMVVWGGAGPAFGGVEMNSGGRYNPALNAWLPTALVDSPLARESHSAIWTGTEMIVWGGSGAGVELDTGAGYDPVGGSWTTLPAAGAPVARAHHTAVWTGTEMIVWGGFGGPSPGALLDSGGRYDPALIAWQPPPTTSAATPAPRQDHTAEWTGFEMIVWGGTSAAGDEYSGGRYLPDDDKWYPTSDMDVAPARAQHTAVWTGTRMVVWGGLPPEVIGGAYCACTDQHVTPEVGFDLVFTDQITMQWSGTFGIQLYNLYRGSFINGPWAYDHACHDPGLTTPTATDGDDPALGTGYYYLVSGVAACGEGGVGEASNTSPRPQPFPCP
jgi:N-acetylneuraminic acid mutarotase